MKKEQIKNKTLKTTLAFIKAGSWSETLLGVLNKTFDRPMQLEENAMMPLAGGILQHGYQCGMIWGASMAAGAQAFRLYGPGIKAETAAINAAQKVVQSFRNYKGHINCLEITEIDKSSSTLDMIIYFLIKGGTIGCFRMASNFAKTAFDEINNAFDIDSMDEPSSAPVSCAAMLAEKMEATEMQIVMAAGFAGGIGLCGGACGVLGAAIWLLSMRIKIEEQKKIDFRDPRAQNIIDKFLEITDYKFECSEIVGRKFDDVKDHSEFLKAGGCSKIINELSKMAATI